MKFLIDAHLPYALCALLRQHGLDAVHTRELPAQNSTSDQAINRLSIEENRIVITKDTDFYYPHVLHANPFKLVLIRTGNLGMKDLMSLFPSTWTLCWDCCRTTRWWRSVTCR